MSKYITDNLGNRYSLEGTMHDLPRVQPTPAYRDSGDYTYDVPAPEALHPLTDIAALRNDIAALSLALKQQQTDMGIMNLAMLEMVSRVEVLEYKP